MASYDGMPRSVPVNMIGVKTAMPVAVMVYRASLQRDDNT